MHWDNQAHVVQKDNFILIFYLKYLAKGGTFAR